MSFKKETEKIVLLQVKGLIQIIVKFRTEKNLCTFFYHPPVILFESYFEGTQNIAMWHQVV